MVDGSFCRGTDIVKAIMLGADLVGIGRLQCWALAAGGEAGIMRMLELLEDEVVRTLGLLGVTKFAELDRSYLHPATPTNLPERLLGLPAAGHRALSVLKRTPNPIGLPSVMNEPLLSPGDADALLFDLGRVVLDIDFSRVVALLGAPCRLRADTIGAALHPR